ncbi:MAG TPA: SMP-30/gluconolactonase/LRE family protein [Steroidobacteraceae bacterium]|nr:SMP-30/gluconolactonase/LRE family protein [Steroidobacteraceae bacterium]
MSIAVGEIEPVWDYAAQTGESPTWSQRDQSLYWIDIQQPALHCLRPDRSQHRQWDMPAEIGCFALHVDGEHAIVGLRTGVFKLSLATGALDHLAEAPFDPSLYRFNEGACDSTGRFWLGTMFDPKRASDAARPDQPWHSYMTREGLRTHRDFAVVPNGLAWNANDDTMYVAHSQQGIIYAYEFDASIGRLGKRRIFATVPRELGVPDGGTIDAEGGYWSALHGGARLRRYRADGELDFDLPLPVSLPTMCAFGGPRYDTLYITSASAGMDAAQREREPWAGKLLCVQLSMCGRPPGLFCQRNAPL